MGYSFTRVSLRRRVAALSADWLSCYFIVVAATGGLGAPVNNRSLLVLALFFGQVTLLSALQGASLGHRIFGVKIVRFSDGGAITPLAALIRSTLLVTVIFAITFDENGRGLHERWSGSVLTRT